MLRIVAAFVAAVLVTYTSATIAHTQWVMANLADMGVTVTLGDRLGATAHDLAGMAPLYLPMIAAALAVGLLVAGRIIRARPRWRPLGYSLAGGLAVLAIHVVLYQTFSITPIAAARTTAGLTVQALCGALGGWVFRVCLPRRRLPGRPT
jgi:hypothetical protein